MFVLIFDFMAYLCLEAMLDLFYTENHAPFVCLQCALETQNTQETGLRATFSSRTNTTN